MHPTASAAHTPASPLLHLLHLQALPALSDNYIWLLHDGHRALVVDPGDAAPVAQALEQQRLQLTAICITHHHGDHTAGLAALKATSGATVYGPADERHPIPGVDVALQGGQTFEALGLPWQVLATPGHTVGHIAFFTPAATLATAPGGMAATDTETAARPLLMCGDTLFCAGCGRLFEGTPAHMLASLDTLQALPDATLVCSAHEYTVGNMLFAAAVEADNAQLQSAHTRAQWLRQQQLPTLPSTLALERQINPFLRTRAPGVRAGLQRAGRAPGTAAQADDAAWLAALREWKNQF